MNKPKMFFVCKCGCGQRFEYAVCKDGRHLILGALLNQKLRKALSQSTRVR